MRTILVVVAGALLIAGCGGEDTDGSADQVADSAATETEAAPEPGPRDSASKDDGGSGKPKPGTAIVAGGSEFGEMLYDAENQAIYIFENDSKDESVCYDECAKAWPPVLTKGEPEADAGVDASLLGTIEREDGTTQVTYAGQPLYHYAHEAPGEVRCHNVDLNGGLWWVVGPDGERLA